MYFVRIFDGPEDSEGILIHSPYGAKTRFDIDKVLEGISSMDITLNQNNPGFNRIRPKRTIVEVTHALTGKKLFKGRFLKPEHKMNIDGLLTLKYTCEDRVAYLHDSRQRWAKIQDTSIRGFLGLMIKQHNKEMESEPHKQFKLGNVTVTNPTDNVYRYVGYGTTYEEIKDNLLDRLGGYLRIRDEEDGMYLDYLAEVGKKSPTPITLRSNLQDFKREIDPTQVYSRIVPLGARLETEGEDDYNASEPRLTIESVNNGIDYIENEALVREFGVSVGEITLDDVNTPSTLLLRGEQFFEAQEAALASYDISALNMNLVDKTIAEFEEGDWYDISTQPLANIEDTLQIIGMKINSESPQRDQLTFGAKRITLSQYQIRMNKQTRVIDDLRNQVSSSSRRVMQLQNAYNKVVEDIQSVQADLGVIDVENLPVELQGIHTQLDSIAQSIASLPVFGLATPFEMGYMSPEDKAKLDRISVETYVDLDALIGELDQLKQRVAALEAPEEPPTEPEGVE